MDRFRDRSEGGQRLAGVLAALSFPQDTIVLALPRGGVPVGFEVARTLCRPFDVFIVRKLGVPGHEELAMGAIASGGVRYLNVDVVSAYRIPPFVIEDAATRELRRIDQAEAQYRASRPRPQVSGRDVIVVDDGLATGATMQAAVRALRNAGARRVTVAVPVGANETCNGLRRAADQVICLIEPRDFRAVGLWYEDFSEVSDEQVRSLLAEAPGMSEREIEIDAGGAKLAGTLSLPSNARALVLFAHGSGSGRHSPRNRYVAGVLQNAGFATLLMDLLTSGEERAEAATGQVRFDIALLASRLAGATRWANLQKELEGLPVCYFGASTGAAAALVASVDRQDAVKAIVSRGGRPDLANDALPRVSAPTLLIVGSRDEQVLALNRQAMSKMNCEVALEIVPGATHLFEEAGALERVAALAAEWFGRRSGTAAVRRAP